MMITRSELDSLIETIGILSNSKTMKQIENSEQEILTQNTKEINSIQEL